MSEDLLYCEIVFPLPLAQRFTYLWLRKGDVCDCAPQIGCRVFAPLGERRKVTGWVVALYKKAPSLPFQIKELTKVIDRKPLFNQELLTLAEWLASLYFCSLGEALHAMLPQGQRENSQLDILLSPSSDNRVLSLSAQQQQASNTWKTYQKPLSFLFGVTGAGKTAVFLEAAQHTLAQQRTVIYLVPEITLVYQVYQQLSKPLAETVALLHSQLTLKQYLWQWRLLQDNRAKMVIGTRNAVFAPLENLGLIIIDEEHDSSYKAQARPRFNARHVAMKRCREQKARLLCGGATPSLESWWAMQNERMQTLCVPHYLGIPNGQIEIIDLNRYRSKVLAAPTIEAIEDCCLASKQCILFLNQKGYARALYCHQCQKNLLCPECGINLTFYEKKGLICHYCSYLVTSIASCPLCNSADLSFVGVGTERLEREVRRCFPHRNIARLDADTAKKRGANVSVMEQMQQGRVDILLGTEMVAKGLDFPKVELVVVVLAESGFSLADFRTDERCFMQLMQMSGRAGRKGKGRVLIQTYQPQHPLIQAVSQRQLQEFYQAELNNRRYFSFPPFGRVFRLIFSAMVVPLLDQETVCWAQLLAKEDCWRVLGPAPCPIKKKGKYYRAHILLISQKFDQAHRQLQKIYQERKKKGRCRVEIDVDPLHMS